MVSFSVAAVTTLAIAIIDTHSGQNLMPLLLAWSPSASRQIVHLPSLPPLNALTPPLKLDAVAVVWSPSASQQTVHLPFLPRLNTKRTHWFALPPNPILQSRHNILEAGLRAHADFHPHHAHASSRSPNLLFVTAPVLPIFPFDRSEIPIFWYVGPLKPDTAVT